MAIRISESARGYRESLGPFRIYLLTRGLVLDFHAKEAIVSDDAGWSVSIPYGYQSSEFGLRSPRFYCYLADVIHSILGVRLVGFSSGLGFEPAFRIHHHIISSGELGEWLLSKFTHLENLIRNRVLSETGLDEAQLLFGIEVCAKIQDEMSYGRVGPNELRQMISEFSSKGIPMTEAFFTFNTAELAEDMRRALLAASFHFGNLNLGIRKINQRDSISQLLSNESDSPWEERLSSDAVDELSYFYSSSIVGCYTALDILYAYFVYLTREPFLNPEFPSNLHFPDAPGRNIFRRGGSASPNDPSKRKLPYAIPNLTSGEFTSLRKTRNALAHNMAPDSIRPQVHKGWNFPPVNNFPLQYVQYLSRDLDENGEPVAHPWARRFYENQTDAQIGLLEWLELTWQCALDTTEWLIARWSGHASSP